MKPLADLDYDELLTRAREAARLPDLDELRVDMNPLSEGGKRFWTKTAKGLAKWATHPHPWQALYDHIIKWEGMTPAYAKRIAGEWYYEVFGHGPTAKVASKVRSLIEAAEDEDDEDYAGLDVIDTEVRSGYGDIAVTSDEWLRDRANVFLRGIPDLPRPIDALRRLSDDERMFVLELALYEFSLENQHLRAFNPALHKRWPKGTPNAGKYRPMIDLLKQAIHEFDPKKDRHPFIHFSRPQLLKAARDRGIKLDRGEHEDSIAAKLLKDLGAPTPATPAAAKKAAPAKKVAAAVKAVKVAGPDDGLDKLDEHRLRGLAQEYGVIPNRQDTSKTRDQIIDALRAQGALAPDVKFKRIDEMKGLEERLKNLGRRKPADDGSLDHAAASLADGTDVKAVAKQLRKDADGIKRKEDADTLRFLASDLTRKKKTEIPKYLDANGRIDLLKLAELNSIDIKRWMPLDRAPKQGLAMLNYQAANPFDNVFRSFREQLENAAGPGTRAKAIRNARSEVNWLRAQHGDAVAGRGIWTWNSRIRERDRMIAEGPELAATLERLADLAEAAKVPKGKRAVTLGGTSLGEIVQVDEGRFRSRPLKEVLAHRGATIPEGFVHKGSGTDLVRDPKAPQRPGLSDAENRALDLYTVGVVADGVNGSLRKGRNVHGEIQGPTGTVDLDQISRDLDAALSDSKLTQDTVLWRGTVSSTADFRRLVPGAVYTDLGYLSTSTDELGARRTIDWRQRNGTIPAGRKPLLFKILAPAGTNAALGHERVKEALLPRGQELRVVRVDETASPPVVVMEVVPRHVEPGVVKGRSIVDDFDYDGAVRAAPHNSVSSGLGGGKVDEWLGAIRKTQGFDGKPKVVSRQEMDEAVRDGSTQLFRAIKDRPGNTKTTAQLAEDYRTGELFHGTGVYGSGTYMSPERETALIYGEEKTMLRIALRRDARVISIADLLKLRPRTGITATAAKLADERQAELNRVDPKDTAAIKAIVDKYEALTARQGSRSRVAGDIGRVGALLGYDAIYVPRNYRGPGSKGDDQTEYVILNRTATIVEEAQP